MYPARLLSQLEWRTLTSDFSGKDVVSAKDFKRTQLEQLFQAVDDLERHPGSLEGALKGKLAALLFFEPSTRTYSTFQIAARNLGMKVSGFSDAGGSSVSKGETLHDTVRMFEGYGADCFIIRHKRMGAARFAAKITDVPVVNGGAGPCTADFVVKDASGKGVYNAKIDIQVRYGFMGLHRLDATVQTNFEGKARIEGLPEQIKKTAEFNVSQGGQSKSLPYDPQADCHPRPEVVLGDKPAT